MCYFLILIPKLLKYLKNQPIFRGSPLSFFIDFRQLKMLRSCQLLKAYSSILESFIILFFSLLNKAEPIYRIFTPQNDHEVTWRALHPRRGSAIEEDGTPGCALSAESCWSLAGSLDDLTNFAENTRLVKSDDG